MTSKLDDIMDGLRQNIYEQPDPGEAAERLFLALVGILADCGRDSADLYKIVDNVFQLLLEEDEAAL